MKANFNFNDIYKKLTENEKQACDLCRDWNLVECEKCEFISRFSYKNKEVNNMNIVLYTIGCKNCEILDMERITQKLTLPYVK